MKKYAIVTTISFLNFSLLFGQENKESILLETKGKTQLYYVELNTAGGSVFEMGNYLDKAGSGSSIRSTDTLTRKSDQSNVTYSGKRTRILNENGKLYLEIQGKKTSRYKLDSVTNSATANSNLNNAYYLDHFIALCDELNKSYPLDHYSFRTGFTMWNSLDHKEIPHAEFKTYADFHLRELKDSITHVQDQYVLFTNTLIQNIKTIEYDALKDSLKKLPSESNSTGKYFGTVINEVAKERPEFFFKLAEDHPEKRKAIFNGVVADKKTMAGLKLVENHKDIKREFFREKRFDKGKPIRIIATSAVAALIVILLL